MKKQMKKRVITPILSLFAILMMSMTMSGKSGYTVTGTVKGAQDGDTVVLAEMQYLYLIPIDTTIIKNGIFTFKGDQKDVTDRCIGYLKNGEIKGCNGFILENANITVNIEEGIQGGHGTPNNELWNQFNEENQRISAKAEPYWKVANDSTIDASKRAEAQKKVDEVEKQQSEYLVSFICQNITSGIGNYLVKSYYPSMDVPTLQKIMGAMEKAGAKNETYTTISQKLKAIQTTAIGSNFTDIELNDPDGKPIKLSTYVAQNKVTLIDFWASWCGPCLAEMPNVIKAYELYKDKGFGIVGVSLDNKAEAWKACIQRLKLSWPQMSDLKGWQSKGAAAYDVTAIPATVLVNQDGKIIGKNLRGEELTDKLKELLITK